MKLKIELRQTILKRIEIDLDGTDYDRESAKGKHEIVAEMLAFPLAEVTEEELKAADTEEVEVLNWDIEE